MVVVLPEPFGPKNPKISPGRNSNETASTAVKGLMSRYLLSLGATHVVYLVPDIAVFHSLDRVIEKLTDHSVILTPHQVSPNSQLGHIRDNELAALKYGIFNLGFVAIKNDETGHALADWWDARTYEACYEAVETGIFTDQKWCDVGSLSGAGSLPPYAVTTALNM